MSRHIIFNLFSFLTLVLLQIFVLNNIEFMGFINPYVYILFILLLPLETPKWLLLFLGFLLGYTIDYFSHTIGLNIAATVLVAYLRPKLISLIIPKLEPGPEIKIGIRVLVLSHFCFTQLFWF